MLDRRDEVLGSVASDLATTALALARRFHHGATLWCWAPGAPHHAQHVAVEFVHPVVVGSRALPAVALLGHDALDALRPQARAGDVLLAIGDGDAPVERTLRRAQAWGLTTIWMGAGTRPLTAHQADHLLWMGDDPTGRHDGHLVRGYHVLWELTHVCFEHPGLLGEPIAGDTVVCTTCSDEGRLAEVVGVDDGDATVRSAAGTERISTLMVGEVQPGDLVLVHAGTAISVVDQ